MAIKLSSIILATFLLLGGASFAGHRHPERWYQDRWCAEQGGETEITMKNGRAVPELRCSDGA